MIPALEPLVRRDTIIAAVEGVMLTGVFAVSRWPWQEASDPSDAGTPMVVAAAAVLVLSGNASNWLLLPLAILFAGGWLASRGRLELGAVLVAAGAAVLGFGPVRAPGPLWVQLVVTVATVVVAVALVSFDFRRRSLGLPLLVLAVGGLYGTTPDTEQSAILLTAVLGAGLFGWLTRAAIGTAASPALAGLVVWTAAVGGRGRHSAIVGGLACLGILLVEPLIRVAAGLRQWHGRGRSADLLVLAALQAGVVLGAHAAGVSRSVGRSVAGSGAVLVLGFDVLLLLTLAERSAWARHLGWRWGRVERRRAPKKQFRHGRVTTPAK